MKHLLHATLFAAISALTLPAHAELVATDVSAIGDSRATLDTETGIEWLDLTETAGMSIAQVQDKLSTDYAGWRLPTTEEVGTLMLNFYNTGDPLLSHYSLTSNAVYNNMKNLFGMVYRNGHGHEYTAGLYLNTIGDAFNTSLILQAGTRFVNQSPTKYYAWSQNSYADTLTSSGTASGVFLVSDGGTTLSSINDPSLNANNPNSPANAVSDVSVVGGLALLPLLLLGGRRKKNKHLNNS